MKLALLPVLALSLATPAMAETGGDFSGSWDYMGTSSIGTDYFGQIKRKIGNQVVLKIRIVDNPKSENKDYVIINGIKCKERLVNQGGKWQEPTQDSVWHWWIDYACQ